MTTYFWADTHFNRDLDRTKHGGVLMYALETLVALNAPVTEEEARAFLLPRGVDNDRWPRRESWAAWLTPEDRDQLLHARAARRQGAR